MLSQLLSLAAGHTTTAQPAQYSAAQPVQRRRTGSELWAIGVHKLNETCYSIPHGQRLWC